MKKTRVSKHDLKINFQTRKNSTDTYTAETPPAINFFVSPAYSVSFMPRVMYSVIVNSLKATQKLELLGIIVTITAKEKPGGRIPVTTEVVLTSNTNESKMSTCCSH